MSEFCIGKQGSVIARFSDALEIRQREVLMHFFDAVLPARLVAGRRAWASALGAGAGERNFINHEFSAGRSTAKHRMLRQLMSWCFPR